MWEKKIFDFGQARISQIQHMRHKQQKKKKAKLDFIKMENFCSSRDTIKNIKMQMMEWEKILAMYIPDK